MRNSFLLLFLTFSLAATTQTNRRIVMGVVVSPDYTYRDLTSSDTLKVIKLNRSSSATTGYSAHFVFQTKLLPLFGFETGIGYTQKGEQTTSDSTKGGRMSTYNEQFLYNFLQIPLKLKLNLSQARTTIFITAGASGMMFLDAIKNAAVTSAGQTNNFREELKKEAYEKFNYAVMFSVGLDFEITKRCFFRIEPNFTKSLNSIRTDNLQSYLYGGGINFGLLFASKK